ncbi:hypothetical protein GCM10008015_27560 [Flavobacterium palustre]|uniref:YcxB-like protein domain-containing protein n=1 Tax=Flavobacterium palustre TaxID=1476463 RepID=A0ABQ1HQQ7_9FLAO|nr:hypothetical protein [Flavobacterium palustre]GGA85291.1 hypothetical protein GCM10008015_27560 [Flavobacterium palustre]
MLKSLFEENTKAPEETIISLSKSYSYFQIFGGIVYIVLCLVAIFSNFSVSYKILCFLILIYLTYALYSNVKESKTESKVCLKLNDKGIQIKSNKFITWSKIETFEFISRPNYSSSSQSKDYLVLNTSNGKEEIFLNELNISSQKLNYLLKIYKNRSLKKS